MNGIKYYVLDENEEVPYEFVVIGNVNGEPEFYASFVNTNSLAYENGVLLKLHERNDELRAENAKLRELVKAEWGCVHSGVDCYECRVVAGGCTLQTTMRELGIE